jgi:hypothetical protein
MLFTILLAYTAKSFGSSCTLAESGNLDIHNFEPPKIYKPRPKKKFKVAFFGDQGLGANPMSVLKMIKDWGAELVVISGDYDYQGLKLLIKMPQNLLCTNLQILWGKSFH